MVDGLLLRFKLRDAELIFRLGAEDDEAMVIAFVPTLALISGWVPAGHRSAPGGG
jgi:hypothetical protein